MRLPWRRYSGPVCQCGHPYCMHWHGTGMCWKSLCACNLYTGPLPEPDLTEMEKWAAQEVRKEP